LVQLKVRSYLFRSGWCARALDMSLSACLLSLLALSGDWWKGSHGHVQSTSIASPGLRFGHLAVSSSHHQLQLPRTQLRGAPGCRRIRRPEPICPPRPRRTAACVRTTRRGLDPDGSSIDAARERSPVTVRDAGASGAQTARGSGGRRIACRDGSVDFSISRPAQIPRL